MAAAARAGEPSPQLTRQLPQATRPAKRGGRHRLLTGVVTAGLLLGAILVASGALTEEAVVTQTLRGMSRVEIPHAGPGSVRVLAETGRTEVEVLRVPVDVSVNVVTDGGAVELEGVNEASVQTVNGDVTVLKARGTVSVASQRGHLSVIDSQGSSVRAQAAHGRVSVNALVAPDLVEVDAGESVTVTVPEGSYDVRGELEPVWVGEGIVDDDTSRRVTEVRSLSGSVGQRFGG